MYYGKKITFLLASMGCLFVRANQFDHAKIDSIKPTISSAVSTLNATPVSFAIYNRPSAMLKQQLSTRTAFAAELGMSKQGKSIKGYYFPGTSNKRALVIGGVHGSELSGIEVARKLLTMLQVDGSGYYSVMVIPCLFPDNEEIAIQFPDGANKKYNPGRYSGKIATDPNRQMPALGHSFDYQNPFDFLDVQ